MSEMLNLDQWKAKAAGLSFQNRAFIGGHYVAAASGETFDCISPRDGSLLTRVSNCGEEDVDRAVATARAAFEKGDWRDMAPKDRKAALLKFAQLIEDDREDLALMESLDMGKPIKIQHGRRHSRRGQDAALVRRGDRQGLRPHRADPDRRAGARHPRTHGRRRGGDAVELSALSVLRLEGRTRAGGGAIRSSSSPPSSPR